MTFAWPCLLPKACVDPACKYSGHLLLAHIIAKFAIHKKIVLQVRRNETKERKLSGEWVELNTELKAHIKRAKEIAKQIHAETNKTVGSQTLNFD